MRSEHETGKAIAVVMLLFFIGQVDSLIFHRITNDGDGVDAVFDFFHLSLEHATVHGDTSVRGT